MADDIRYSKIGRHLGQQGYQYKGSAVVGGAGEPAHAFDHPKTGNSVHVSKKEYVGGHKWDHYKAGSKVASGIGHYPELHEGVLPGFLNYITEKEIKVKVKAKVKIEVPDNAKVKAKGK